MAALQQTVSQSKALSASHFKWVVLGQALVLVPLLLGLGAWQLQRAEEKELLLAEWQQATSVKALDALDLKRFDRVKVDGRLDPMHFFLLDNRVRDGVVGYDVIGIFKPEAKQVALLVMLGWVVAGDDRSQLPPVHIPEQTMTLFGRLDRPQPGLTLANDLWGGGWPKRIQQLDPSRVTQVMAVPLHPWLMRPDQELISGRPTPWQPVVVPPERHWGYAVQWFGLGLMWAVLSIWFGWKQGRSAITQGGNDE